LTDKNLRGIFPQGKLKKAVGKLEKLELKGMKTT